MIGRGTITGGVVTHQTGSVDDIAAVSPESQRDGVAELLRQPGVEEALVLVTCNRAEAYVVTDDHERGRAAIDGALDGAENALAYTDHEDSLRHLLRVAAGLESVVVGEDQILGQLRTAIEDARNAGGIGELLDVAATKAIHVGERVRTETAINEGVVSLGSAAATVLAREVDIAGARALVVGAGTMGTLAARTLADRGVDELVVANRTRTNAECVVEELDVGGRAIELDALDGALSDADVVVSATASAEPVIDAAVVEGPQTIVDLGQPRDVDPAVANVDGVTLYDLDDLESVTAQTREQRADAASEAEAIVDREHEVLLEQYKRARADEVIAAMYESAESVKRHELRTALDRLDASTGEFSDDQRAIVESLADALVNQLLAPPTKSLRDAAAEDDWETIQTALQLFDPEFGPDRSVPVFPDREEVRSDASIGAVEDD